MRHRQPTVGLTRRAWLLQTALAGCGLPAWAVDDTEDEPFQEGAPFMPIRTVSVLPLIMSTQITEPELKEYVARAQGPDMVVLKTDAAGRPQRSRKGVPLFQVSQAWVDQVVGRLQPLGVQASRYADPKSALAARRLNDFHFLTTSADAVLDLRIDYAEYDTSMSVSGWHPQLSVSLSLSSMRSGREVAEFQYWSDHREKPKDPRCFTAPRSTFYPDLAGLQANAEGARASLAQTLARMTDKLIDDLRLCVAGRPPEA